MPGLDSLRALHAIKFRTNDQCMWVLQEFRRFTADNLSHHPHLKLEYVAVDISVDRIIRRIPKKAHDKSKGKGKAVAEGGLKPKDGKTLSQLLSESSIKTSTLDPSLLEESEEEYNGEWGLGVTGKMGLKVETVEGLQFYDVTSVKIFEKEILGGRL
jgi:hypothetical protein